MGSVRGEIDPSIFFFGEKNFLIHLLRVQKWIDVRISRGYFHNYWLHTVYIFSEVSPRAHRADFAIIHLFEAA